MAKARMLHFKISNSLSVDKLPMPARLLFTWMIAHADDEGRMIGEPKSIKGAVLPLTNWSLKRIDEYLNLMVKEQLIYYWSENGCRYIEFPKWKDYQTIKGDRFHASKLPSFKDKSGTKLEESRIQSGSKLETESNVVESNKIESKADYPKQDNSFHLLNPRTFEPRDPREVAALETWKILEPFNPLAFQNTYMKACKSDLPVHKFYEFRSQILEDKITKDIGAVFSKKVEEYLSKRSANV